MVSEYSGLIISDLTASPFLVLSHSLHVLLLLKCNHIFPFSVPSEPPEDMTLQLFNSSTAIVMWSPPDARSLNGDLRGYKVIIEAANKTPPPEAEEAKPHEWSNFTLDQDVTSLQLDNLTSDLTYYVRIAAYNRQGMGPFSKPLPLKVDPALLHQYPVQHHPSATGGATVGFGSGGASVDLVVQEVWFVALVAIAAVVIIVAFVATVCVRRKAAHVKNLGHYNGKPQQKLLTFPIKKTHRLPIQTKPVGFLVWFTVYESILRSLIE